MTSHLHLSAREYASKLYHGRKRGKQTKKHKMKLSQRFSKYAGEVAPRMIAYHDEEERIMRDVTNDGTAGVFIHGATQVYDLRQLLNKRRLERSICGDDQPPRIDETHAPLDRPLNDTDCRRELHRSRRPEQKLTRRCFELANCTEGIAFHDHPDAVDVHYGRREHSPYTSPEHYSEPPRRYDYREPVELPPGRLSERYPFTASRRDWDSVDSDEPVRHEAPAARREMVFDESDTSLEEDVLVMTPRTDHCHTPQHHPREGDLRWSPPSHHTPRYHRHHEPPAQRSHRPQHQERWSDLVTSTTSLYERTSPILQPSPRHYSKEDDLQNSEVSGMQPQFEIDRKVRSAWDLDESNTDSEIDAGEPEVTDPFSGLPKSLWQHVPDEINTNPCSLAEKMANWPEPQVSTPFKRYDDGEVQLEESASCKRRSAPFKHYNNEHELPLESAVAQGSSSDNEPEPQSNELSLHTEYLDTSGDGGAEGKCSSRSVSAESSPSSRRDSKNSHSNSNSRRSFSKDSVRDREIELEPKQMDSAKAPTPEPEFSDTESQATQPEKPVDSEEEGDDMKALELAQRKRDERQREIQMEMIRAQARLDAIKAAKAKKSGLEQPTSSKSSSAWHSEVPTPHHTNGISNELSGVSCREFDNGNLPTELKDSTVQVKHLTSSEPKPLCKRSMSKASDAQEKANKIAKKVAESAVKPTQSHGGDLLGSIFVDMAKSSQQPKEEGLSSTTHNRKRSKSGEAQYSRVADSTHFQYTEAERKVSQHEASTCSLGASPVVAVYKGGNSPGVARDSHDLDPVPMDLESDSDTEPAVSMEAHIANRKYEALAESAEEENEEALRGYYNCPIELDNQPHSSNNPDPTTQLPTNCTGEIWRFGIVAAADSTARPSSDQGGDWQPSTAFKDPRPQYAYSYRHFIETETTDATRGSPPMVHSTTLSPALHKDTDTSSALTAGEASTYSQREASEGESQTDVGNSNMRGPPVLSRSHSYAGEGIFTVAETLVGKRRHLSGSDVNHHTRRGPRTPDHPAPTNWSDEDDNQEGSSVAGQSTPEQHGPSIGKSPSESFPTPPWRKGLRKKLTMAQWLKRKGEKAAAGSSKDRKYKLVEFTKPIALISKTMVKQPSVADTMKPSASFMGVFNHPPAANLSKSDVTTKLHHLITPNNKTNNNNSSSNSKDEHQKPKEEGKAKKATAGKFHTRTLLYGKTVQPRLIPLEPLCYTKPVNSRGEPILMPLDPRLEFYTEKKRKQDKDDDAFVDSLL